MEPGISEKGSIIIQLAVFTDYRCLGIGGGGNDENTVQVEWR